MLNIAIIKQGSGKYLFSVPEGITLKEGDAVKCDTKRGETEGVVYADSVRVEEDVAKLIGKLVGASFPLKSVVGKMEYVPFEAPQPEPKYYTGKVVCVDCGRCYNLDVGKVYKVVDGIITMNNGVKSPAIYTPAESIEDLNWKCKKVSGAKFVELKED